MRAVLFASGLVVARGIQCPGSPAFVHAGVTVEAVAHAKCKDVMEEMVARTQGKNGWQDPHNHGVYSTLTAGSDQLLTQRQTNPKTAVGGKVYTDKQQFVFADNADGTCKIEACSQSQGTSVKDFGTNYCDLHNLWCNDETCTPVLHNFQVDEQTVKPNFGSGGKGSKCSTSPKMAAAQTRSLRAENGYVCPSSGSYIHAGFQMMVTAKTDCDSVKAEMKARISGANGWTDPHNKGVYSLLSDSSFQLDTQRTTNPQTSVGGKVYTDKQTFVFSADDSGSCQIYACSQSQSFSIMDFSTNYCDLHNLYCNDEVCHPINSFETVESELSPNLGSGGKDVSKCGPKADFVV